MNFSRPLQANIFNSRSCCCFSSINITSLIHTEIYTSPNRLTETPLVLKQPTNLQQYGPSEDHTLLFPLSTFARRNALLRHAFEIGAMVLCCQ